MAFFVASRDFVNAGGSRMTTSYFSPSAARCGSSSSTFAQRNLTVSERLFLLAFSVACLTANSDISSPVTSFAPAIPTLQANVPQQEL